MKLLRKLLFIPLGIIALTLTLGLTIVIATAVLIGALLAWPVQRLLELVQF